MAHSQGLQSLTHKALLTASVQQLFSPSDFLIQFYIYKYVTERKNDDIANTPRTLLI